MRESLSQASLRVPFRVKLAVVWLGIFGVLSVLFALVHFDLKWMRQHYLFILRGLPFTLITKPAARNL